MKQLLTKLAFGVCSIALLSGIILIRAMTTTDTQTIMEDVSTAQDQMMEAEDEKSAMDTTMETEMQEIAEPGITEMQEPTGEQAIGEEFTQMEAPTEQTEAAEVDISAEEQPVADEEGTPAMEGMPEQEQAEQEAQEVNVIMEEDENTDADLAP